MSARSKVAIIGSGACVFARNARRARFRAASSGSGSPFADACPGSIGGVVMLIDETPWLTSMAVARNVVTKI
jgi:hypothetical protein